MTGMSVGVPTVELEEWTAPGALGKTRRDRHLDSFSHRIRRFLRKPVFSGDEKSKSRLHETAYLESGL